MTKSKATIENHPVATYFVLTFMISWGGVLILGAPHGMPTTQEQFKRLYPIVFLPYLLGPLVSGIVLTALEDGKAGFRNLFSRLIAWRVNVRWYVIALLTAPLLTVAILLVLSLVSPAFLPAIFTADDKLAFLFLYYLVLAAVLWGIVLATQSSISEGR